MSERRRVAAAPPGEPMPGSTTSGHSIQIGSTAGDALILLDRPDYRLDLLIPTAAARRRVPRSHQLPSYLLDPQREVVPYRPRLDEQRRLDDWRDGVEEPVSVLLVSGPAGHGKTRLAGHFAFTSYQCGWVVSQGAQRTSRLRTGAAGQHILDLGRPLLVVVDHAEHWRLAVLTQLVENLALDYPERRVRVLLLARSVPSLWPMLAAALHHGGAHLARPVELGEFIEPAGRAQAFAEAAAAFALQLQVPQRPPPPEDLTAADYGSPLTLHMAALAAVCAAEQAQPLPDRQDLSRFLLGYERRHWNAPSVDGHGPSPEVIEQVVLLATLLGPFAGLAAGQTLLRQAGLADDPAEAARLVMAHERLYPSEPPQPSDPVSSARATTGARATTKQTLVPLRPDWFGEDFVGQYLTRAPHTAQMLAELLTVGAPAPPARRCLAVLAAAAPRHPAAAATLFTLLRDRPNLAAQVSATVLQLVVDHAPDDVAEAVDEALPRFSSELRQPAYHLAQRLYAALPADAPASRRAARLTILGHRLTALGDKSGALAPTREAVGLYRWLAETEPDAYLPDLALALSNLGGLLAAMGDRSGSLAPIWQAVGIYRQLAEAEPDAHLPGLALALSTLGGRLVEVGDKRGALAFSQEVVQIRRRLAEAEPEAYLPDLALALSNLGERLPAVGDKSGALAPTREAVDIYQRLAGAEPVAHLPHLAKVLSNLGARLAAVGDKSGALAPTWEAVDIYRRLAEAEPDAYLPDLAVALNNLGVGLAAVGDKHDAQAASREAVEINRRLAETEPAAYLPNLANSLWARAWIGADGDDELADALAAVDEAVGIYSSLAERLPAVFVGYLLAALRTRADLLDRLGRDEEAEALRRVIDHMVVSHQPDSQG
ncbi:MAG: tetratricopeptide repeat protein, partial [Pseudonocardiaceae bacterium]